MKAKLSAILAVLFIASLIFVPSLPTAADTNAPDRSQQVAGPPGNVDQARVAAALRSSPVMFIENVGQFDAGARFQVRGSNATVFLADDAIWITLQEQPQAGQADRFSFENRVGLASTSMPNYSSEKEAPPVKTVNLKLSFVGANPNPMVEPFDRLDTHVSYFIGDPEKWRADVPVWGGARYKDLYPGIDLEMTSEGGRMVHRMVSRPGADPGAVQLQVDGADGVSLSGARLSLTTAAGDFTLPLFSLRAECRIEPEAVDAGVCSASFVPSVSKGSAGVGAWAIVAPVVVVADGSSMSTGLSLDSTLHYATFLGGSGRDEGSGIAVDSSGNSYVTGLTYSTDFPATLGSGYDLTLDGTTDAFVAKVNASGMTLIYATFLGGSGSDSAAGIAVDGMGNAYVTGVTASANFPAASGPGYDRTYNGGSNDAFVVKLNGDGTALTYATFLGGYGNDWGNGIAVDGEGKSYVVGNTDSGNFPAALGPGYDSTYNGGFVDAYVVKLNASGMSIDYATFLGGSSNEAGSGVAVDRLGDAYVTGGTSSTDFPAFLGPGYDTTHNGGGYDVFLAKLNPSGTGLLYATFIGGSSYDWGNAIVVDGDGNGFATGYTSSADFPAALGPGNDMTFNGGSWDAFVVKLNSSGTSLHYSTFLGGSGSDHSIGLAVDSSGNAYVTGRTSSGDFPAALGPGYDTTYNGNIWDVFVVKLDAGGATLLYATFLGGSGYEWANGIALDGEGSAYVIGLTSSGDFPAVFGPGFDTSFNGGDYDSFVVKLTFPVPMEELVIGGPTAGVVSRSYSFMASVAPISSSVPITFVWEGSEQSVVTNTSGISDTNRFIWNAGGPQLITVTAWNSMSRLTGTLIIDIIAPTSRLFLPLTLRASAGSW